MRRRTVLGALCALGIGGIASAQGVPRNAVVVIDQDVLFARSRFGQRIREEIEQDSRALAAENREIETELEAEERALTARRADTDPTLFRDLADAFDARVGELRETQDAKARAIQQRSDQARDVFQARVGPLLSDLAQDAGALVVLDSRMVIAVADEVDITDRALERIDAELGDGTRLTGPPPSRPASPATGD